MRIEGAIQGVFTDWYNPWDVLGDLAVAEYGWVEAHDWGVTTSTGGAGSGTTTSRRDHAPMGLETRWSSAVLQALTAQTANERLTIDVLTLKRESNGEYTQRRIESLTNAWAHEVAMESTPHDGGGLMTSGTLRFVYDGIGVTDFETNTSYSDEIRTF